MQSLGRRKCATLRQNHCRGCICMTADRRIERACFCRLPGKNVSTVRQAISFYRRPGVPLEAQHSDPSGCFSRFSDTIHFGRVPAYSVDTSKPSRALSAQVRAVDTFPHRILQKPWSIESLFIIETHSGETLSKDSKLSCNS